MDRYLDYCERTGRPADKPFSGTFNVRVGEDRHRALAHKAAQLGIAINDAVCQAVEAWVNPASIEPTHNHIHLHIEGLSEMKTLVATSAAQTYRTVPDVTAIH